jgi:hypothetical protein
MEKLETIIKYRYFVAIIIFSFLVVGKFHGSSIAFWDYIVTEKINSNENTLIVGEARGIRSDEWKIMIPMYLSQTMKKFPLINPNIRSNGQNMLFSTCSPVKSICMIAKPSVWGFILLGKEYGLSWYWYSRLLLLILLSFEMCMLLTDKNIFISLLGALWISYSPYMQWWLHGYTIEYLISAQLIIVSIWHYITTTNRTVKLFLAIFFVIGASGFIFHLYPAMQVPIGYMVLIFIIFIIYCDRSKIKLGKYDYILFSSSVVAVSILVFIFISSTYDAIKIMVSTSYPGQRVIRGGGFDFNYLQLYLSNWFLPFKNWSYSHKDYMFWNSCEASTIPNFLPAIMIGFFWIRNSLNYKKYLFYALFIYLLFLMTLLLFSYPEWFEKYSLFSYQKRLYNVVHIISFYLSLWVLSVTVKSNPLKWRESIIITLFVSLIYYHSIKHSLMFSYMGVINSVISILFFFALNLFFLKGMKKPFAIFMAIYIIISGYWVNPLSRGVGSIYNKVAAEKILAVEKKHPGKKWAALNTWDHGDYLVALGVKTLNSVHFYPDLELWQKLDPFNYYYDIYNRFAHVVVSLTNEKTHFILNTAESFTVFININDLLNTDVEYLLSLGKLKGYNNIIKQIDQIEKDNLYIYKLERSHQNYS